MGANVNHSRDDKNTGLTRRILVVLATVGVSVGILLFFLILSFAVRKLNKKPEVKKRSRPVIAVMSTRAVADTVTLRVNVQGESRPRTEIDLVPEVGGKIIWVSPKFISGGIFNKGDVLYRIDPSDYDVAVVRAEAAVARAMQILIREQSEGAIAKLDWEDLGEGRQATDLTLRKPQLLEAQAGLQSAQAGLDNAKIRRRRTEIKAPFNGRVREKFADLGQFVNPGARLGRIFSTNIAEVRLALSDNDIARLDLPLAFVAKSRQTAPDVILSAKIGGHTRTWHGKIMRTDAAYDPQTRSMFAIAEVLNPYGKGAAEGHYPLAPGLFVNAQITGKTYENIIVIPRDGLRPENKVFIVNMDGIAESRSVNVLDTDAQNALLSSGVEAGEIVILSPMEESQISLKFRALDINNTDMVLVEPKKDEPQEDTDKPEDTKTTSKKKKKKKKKKGDAKGAE